MKASLYIQGITYPQSGYLPISLEELPTIDRASVEEITVVDSLDYCPNTSELIETLADKLQYGGILTIESTNIIAVMRGYRYGQISSVQLNQLLYHGKRSVVSNGDVVDILKILGLNIIKQSLQGFKYCITAQRPKV